MQDTNNSKHSNLSVFIAVPYFEHVLLPLAQRLQVYQVLLYESSPDVLNYSA